MGGAFLRAMATKISQSEAFFDVLSSREVKTRLHRLKMMTYNEKSKKNRNILDVQKIRWTSKHFLDVQKIVLNVQAIFNFVLDVHKNFRTSNLFWDFLDVQTHFWTSNQVFGRPHNFLDVQDILDVQTTFRTSQKLSGHVRTYVRTYVSTYVRYVSATQIFQGG